MRTKIYNKITTPVLTILALIIFGATNIKAAPGDLDTTFGSGGSVVTPARLKDELMKIVAEDNRSGSYPDALRRFFPDKALLTNSYGLVASAAEWIDATANNPFKPPAGFSAESEFSGGRLEDFADLLVMDRMQILKR